MEYKRALIQGLLVVAAAMIQVVIIAAKLYGTGIDGFLFTISSAFVWLIAAMGVIILEVAEKSSSR